MEDTGDLFLGNKNRQAHPRLARATTLIRFKNVGREIYRKVIATFYGILCNLLRLWDSYRSMLDIHLNRARGCDHEPETLAEETIGGAGR